MVKKEESNNMLTFFGRATGALFVTCAAVCAIGCVASFIAAVIVCPAGNFFHLWRVNCVLDLKINDTSVFIMTVWFMITAVFSGVLGMGLLKISE